MTDFKPDDNLADWDAAYVLGALSLEERRTYESYLAANPARAAELTELAGMPGILNALSRDEAGPQNRRVKFSQARDRA